MKRLWEEIRKARFDLTDYVIHLTRGAQGKSALDILINILRCNQINGTFAPMRSRNRIKLQNTIKGPDPAVCFTDGQLHPAMRHRLPLACAANRCEARCRTDHQSPWRTGAVG